jgi:FKBP-type peptidyl-prolyl cis-trans isomerase SlyD
MQLTKDKVGTVNYTLKDKDGKIIDETQDGSFAYLHGARNIIPGLENELEGKEIGYKNSIVIEPKDAYGERDMEQIQRVPLSMFPDDVEISEGMQFEAQADDGAPIVVTVTAIDAGEVTVDGNHPLAGIQLYFDIEVLDVRDASNKELEQGHALTLGDSEQ